MGSTPAVGTSGDNAKTHDDAFFSGMTNAGLQPLFVSLEWKQSRGHRVSRAAEGVRVPEVTSSTLATIGSELPQPREVGKRGIKVSSPNAVYGRQL